MKKIELLAPAGDFECVVAAINSGADAIYVGGEEFSARAYAENFTNDQLKETIRYAHIRGVKVYVTINTMVYDDELSEIKNFVDFLYENDVDGLIVSDFGLINLFRERYPDLPVHLSTQANVTNLWQVKFYEQYGIKRIVLARETDISTIRYLKKNTSIEFEVFAHGALCVCYSGNCLHSSMIGKRSGNRGKCAQPCRMEYTLSSNGKAVGETKYLLSMKDLNTLEYVGELIDSGVESLKIEGRMKTPEYVSLVTKTYRKAIDKYYADNKTKLDKIALEEMNQVFSRGFTKGHLFFENNKDLINTYRPSHLGIKVGKVEEVKNEKVSIKLSGDLKQKDKIAIVQEKYPDVKMFLSKITVKNRLVPQGYKNETIELEIHSKVAKDAIVYKLTDNELEEEIRKDYQENKVRIPIRMKFFANVGKNMALSVKDYDGHSVMVKSEYIVDKAINSATGEEKIKEQLGKVSATAYMVKELTIQSDNQGIIPVKFINDLRREAIARLDDERANIYHRDISNVSEGTDYISYNKANTRKIKVKVHTLAQLEALNELMGIDAIYYDDIFTYEKAAKAYPELNIIPVLPRIMNDKSKAKNIEAKNYVINNYGDILKEDGARLISDIYMNVANKETIAELVRLNLESISLSTELNQNQIRELIEDFENEYGFIPPLEMVVYGHIQTMITKYCFIAKEYGYEGKNCGVCRTKKFELIDRMHYAFPVTTDLDCNVTIYNSKALHLIDCLEDIYSLGISSVRLDFSVESPQEVYEITKAYLDKINYGEYELDIKDVTYGYFNEVNKN